MRRTMLGAVVLALAVSLACGTAVRAADVVPPPPPGMDEAKVKEYLEKLKQEINVTEQYKAEVAKHFLESGKKRYAERRYEDAERDLSQALAANPGLVEAKDLLAKVRGILGKTEGGEADIVTNMVNQRDVQLGFALREMRSTLVEARQLLKEDKFGPALERLDQARNAAKVLAARVDVSRELAEINGLIDRATESRDKTQKDADQKKIEEAKAMAEADRARVVDLQTQRTNRLFEDAKGLYKDMRYLDAVKKAQEILRIDPRNKEVAAFLEDCHKMQETEDVRWYTKTMAEETAANWRDTHKISIPFSQVQPVYPPDWEEKRKRTAGIQMIEESPEEAEFKKKMSGIMEEPISFDFIATPLDDVVAFLRNMKHVNIVVDKGAVKDRGALDVTLKLDKVPFKDALDWILRLLDLRYSLENGAIFVSTKEKIQASKKHVTRFYDVTDLTVEIRDFKPNLQAISSSDMGDVQQGENVQDIFAEADAGPDAKKETFTGESLVEFIKSVIAPETWVEGVGVAAKGI